MGNRVIPGLPLHKLLRAHVQITAVSKTGRPFGRTAHRLKRGGGPFKLRPLFCVRGGGVAEWSKAHAWNACRRVTVSRVRIPPPPPVPIDL
jgi:hypothetical protein